MDKWQEILQLLKRAEDGSTTKNERKSLMDQAEYLMAKFGFEMIVTNETGALISKIFDVKNPYALKKNVLLNNIGVAFGCVSIRKKDEDAITVFGYEADLGRVTILYNSLVVQMFVGLHDALPLKPIAMHGKAYSSSWVNDYVSQVIERVQENVARARRDSEVGELLIRDRHLAVITEVTNKYPNFAKYKIGCVV